MFTYHKVSLESRAEDFQGSDGASPSCCTNSINVRGDLDSVVGHEKNSFLHFHWKPQLGVKEGIVMEALSHCTAEMSSIPAVGYDRAQRLSPQGRAGGKEKLAVTTPILLPLPFSPTASINLRQLLPPAKPCLRETDLKGPKWTEQLHCGVTAPPLCVARGRNCSHLGQRHRGFVFWIRHSQGRSTIHSFSRHKRDKMKEDKYNFNTEFISINF